MCFQNRSLEQFLEGPSLGPQNFERSSTPVEGERPFRDPVFHVTIIIIVLLGHRGLLKYICSMEIDSFSVFVAFRCAMFYTTCLSLVFHKTSVNDEPLSPPILGEFAAPYKQIPLFFFFILLCLRLQFFYFC